MRKTTEICPRCGMAVKLLSMHMDMHGNSSSSGTPAVTPAVIPPLPVIVAPVQAPAPAVVVQQAPAATMAAPAMEPIGGAIGVDAPNGFFVFDPEEDVNFLVHGDVSEELAIADRLSSKHPVNILVTGNPGGGKTSLGLQFAAKYHRKCVVVDFGVLQEPQELFHTTRLEVVEGGHSRTDIRESGFVKGIETPGCVVILDELNRPENERVLNVLLPFLDGRRQSYIDYLRRLVKVADGVVFIATLNEGAMFCGVSSVDVALRDRFRELHMMYLPPDQEVNVIQRKTGVPESISMILADFGAQIRRNEIIQQKISTRQLLTAAENFSEGDQLWRAVSISIGHYNDPSWRQQCMEVFSLCLKDEGELLKWTNAKGAGGRYGKL